ncbi:MAG: T9SS type A sorting domain-containing protein [Candidatus Electryoneaceae bacterium]|nr:T9SS type A sorting domain-containing protein [Candidatus Electryoneaceae bacterium]
MYKSVICIIVLGLFAVPNLQADQWGEGIHQVGEQFFHGDYTSVEQVDDVLYVTNCYGIEVWDIESLEEPVLRNNFPTPHPSGNISLTQDDLLFVDHNSLLSIYDISDRFEPEFLSEIEGHEFVWVDPVFEQEHDMRVTFNSIILVGDVLIVQTSGKRLTSYDLSDPSDPQIVDDLPIDGVESFAYGHLMERNGEVVFYGNPFYSEDYSRYVMFYSYELDGAELDRVAVSGCEAMVQQFGGIVYPVVVGDEVIYVSDVAVINGIDITDLEDPRYLGEREVERDPIDAFTYCYPVIHENRLYIKTPTAVEILDISDGFEELSSFGQVVLHEPNEEFPFSNPWILDLVAGDGYFATINNDVTLAIWDVEDPENVEELFYNGTGAVDFYARPIAGHIVRKDDVIFCAGTGYASGISIEDIANPETVVERFNWESFGSVFSSVALVGDALYVNYWVDNIVSYDVSDPMNPDSIGEVDISPFLIQPILVGEDDIGLIFYMSGGDEDHTSPTITGYDFSDPFEPTEIIEHSFEEPEMNLHYEQLVSGNNLTMVTFTSILGEEEAVPLEAYFYDLSPLLDEEPVEPEYLGTQDLADLLQGIDLLTDIQIIDELVYLIASDRDDPESARMFIMDSELTEVHSATELVGVGTVTIDDTLAYFLNKEDGLFIYGVSNPEEPAELVGWYNTPGNANQLILVDDHIVVADCWSLQILRLDDEEEGVPPQTAQLPETFSLSEPYPNPFNGQFSFDIHLPQADNVQFYLYDVTGRQVWSLSNRFGVGVHRQSIDMDNRSAGIYFLRGESSFGTSTKRVVMVK